MLVYNLFDGDDNDQYIQTKRYCRESTMVFSNISLTGYQYVALFEIAYTTLQWCFRISLSLITQYAHMII